MMKHLLLFSLFLLASCAPPVGSATAAPAGQIEMQEIGGGVRRFEDDEWGAVCWVFNQGISCIEKAQLHAK